MIKLHLDYHCDSCYNNTIELSENRHKLKINNKNIDIQIRDNLQEHRCGICGDDTRYSGPLNDITKSFFIGDNIKVSYYHCYNCIHKHLCKTTCKETTICYKDYKLKILIFMFAIKLNFAYIPRDVVGLILKLCKEIKCCWWRFPYPL